MIIGGLSITGGVSKILKLSVKVSSVTILTSKWRGMVVGGDHGCQVEGGGRAEGRGVYTKRPLSIIIAPLTTIVCITNDCVSQ